MFRVPGVSIVGRAETPDYYAFIIFHFVAMCMRDVPFSMEGFVPVRMMCHVSEEVSRFASLVREAQQTFAEPVKLIQSYPIINIDVGK
jgi:hypothetical protein